MSTVADVITGIRDDLKDPDGEKYTDAQIIRYMNRFRVYLAALMFRYQVYAGIKKADIPLSPGVGTYSIYDYAPDFYAEKQLNYSDKTNLLKRGTLDYYIAGGHGTSTATGTSDKYMILGSTLYLFDPLPDGGTIQLWYYYIENAFAATTDTMPHNGILDNYWREFVSKLLMNRDEYNIQYEEFLFRELEGSILSALVGRSPQMVMIPEQYAGSPTKKGIDAFYE
jgi:hypothetical protein